MTPQTKPRRPRDPVHGGPTFPLRHRLYRLFWQAVWLALAAWTPPPLHRWRNLILRSFGAQVAWTARVYGSVRIWYPANLIMGDYATLGPGVICYNMAPVVLDRYAIVSQRAHLCCGTHDINTPQFKLIVRPITIAPYAWICSEAFVGPGVKVGEGAVLAARAAAFRDLRAWQVHLGNPAVAIRPRQPFSRPNSIDGLND